VGQNSQAFSFKDHAILRANPYRVLEGALIGCVVLKSAELIICLKRSFFDEWQRVTGAIEELSAAGWLKDVAVRYVAGPGSYLFGEETALLEVASGRHPFPRVTPPWRRGVDETSDSSALAVLAGTAEDEGTPALVNNVETFANVALIVRNGPEWFRSIGTTESPGSIVCTITGSTVTAAVGEYEMGSTLREVIEDLGGGARAGQHIIGVLPGASSAFVIDEDFDTPLTYETFKAAGSGLGSAGFWALDESDNTARFAYEVSRFLSTESCGQCTPCKDDGIAVTDLLSNSPTITTELLSEINARLETITQGARCSLASQQQVVIRSLLALIPQPGDRDFKPLPTSSELSSVHIGFAPLSNLECGAASIDLSQESKQPDWSYDEIWSGQYPIQRLQDAPAEATDVSSTEKAK
jgi:NADH-quinone oxidoreductase subunit F